MVALGFIILLSFAQLFMSAMVIPRFAEIFRDMLGNRPLPALTAAVIHFRWVLAGVAVVASLAAAFVVRRRASPRYLYAILALLLFQNAFVTLVLFLPLLDGGIIQAATPAQ